MTNLYVKIDSATTETDEIRSFRLVPVDGMALPAFTAGAHIDVHVDADTVRQYSIASDPRDTSHYVIAVKKEAQGRGGSLRMHERFGVGDLIRISAPRNLFALADQAGRHLLFAGGVGLTPILAMARSLAAAGSSFSLFGFFRTAGHVPFRDLLDGETLRSHTAFHFDDGTATLDLKALLQARREGDHLYACGPAGFMDAVKAAAQGWPADSIHCEYFAAPAASALGPDAQEGSFEVKLARSNITVKIPPGRSIIDVLLEHGVQVESSCKEGICGACAIPYLEGSPDHRDLILSEAQRQTMLTLCCSRSLSPQLVVDL